MNSRNRGFTLIELSIVLVIIGLIVGGVLVGRDLIQAAQIRAQMTQIEQINAATNTFRGKYNQLPADLTHTHAVAFGFTPYWDDDTSTTAEDGFIDGTAPNKTEPLVFFKNLDEAHLYACTGCIFTFDWAADKTWDLQFTAAKIGNNDFIIVLGGPAPPNYFDGVDMNKNYIEIYGSYAGSGFAMTPLQAFAIDAKMDDGLPLAGRVQAVNENGGPSGMWYGTRAPASGAAGTDNCVSTSTTPNSYNTTNKGILCGMRVEAQF